MAQVVKVPVGELEDRVRGSWSFAFVFSVENDGRDENEQDRDHPGGEGAVTGELIKPAPNRFVESASHGIRTEELDLQSG